MNSDDILILGLQSTVTAIAKKTGKELWSTDLPGVLGTGFVTVLCDGFRVFACFRGKLHCLDLSSGRIQWSNDLPGLGYGIGSLCFASGPSAPDPATVQKFLDERSASPGANAAHTVAQ